jgi:hypothetical protein
MVLHEAKRCMDYHARQARDTPQVTESTGPLRFCFMIPRRLDFYFGLYDMDGSGSIDEDEIYRLLERGHSSVKNLHQDATKSLLEEVRQEKKRKEKKIK